MIQRTQSAGEREALQAKGRQIEDRGLFVGCPLEIFAETSEDLFLLARSLGLQKTDRVLEVGSGCMRTGMWFVKFLEASHYHGIEPNQEMLAAGRELLLGDLEATRKPSFDHNDRFDLGVFGVKPDWIVAFSVWTHCSKAQIETMIEQAAAFGSRMLVSFAPTHPKRPQYEGDTWIGKSHTSDTKGIAYHDPAYLFAPGGIATGMTAVSQFDSLKVSLAAADVIAKEAIVSYAKGTPIAVPGFSNKVMALLSQILPRTWMASMVGRVYRDVG